MIKILYKKKLIFLFLLVCLISIGGMLSCLFVPYSSNSNSSFLFEIQRGESILKVANRLKEEKVIFSSSLFYIFSRVLDKTNIKSGEYLLSKNISTFDILQLFEKGTSITVPITIREGLNMKEIFSLLEKQGFHTVQDYLALSEDKTFLKFLKIPENITSLEGYLFPETYFFAKNVAPKLILQKMVHTFYENLPQNYLEQAKQVNLTIYEAIILASIIEKETGVANERTLISSVFHNRLHKKMRLEADPTVIYGIKNFDGNITKKHLRTKTKYNTYKMHGLPPTPIANPGLASLQAAVNPKHTEYLYFVAIGNGYHQFSKTYKEHHLAVIKYQKRRSKRKR